MSLRAQAMARKSAASQVGPGMGSGKLAPPPLVSSDSALSRSRDGTASSVSTSFVSESKANGVASETPKASTVAVQRAVALPTQQRLPANGAPTPIPVAASAKSTNRTQMELSRDQQQREQNSKTVESRKRAREAETERTAKGKQLPQEDAEDSSDSDTASDEAQLEPRGVPQAFQRDTVKRSLGLLFLADDDAPMKDKNSATSKESRVQQTRSVNLVARAKESHC